MVLSQLLAVLKKYNVGRTTKRLKRFVKNTRKCRRCRKVWGKLHISRLNRITRVLSAVNDESDQINLIVNTDRIPVFKSSNIQLRPVLCMFGGMYLFLVAVFSGEEKPNDFNSFLWDLLQECGLLKKKSVWFSTETLFSQYYCIFIISRSNSLKRYSETRKVYTFFCNYRSP